MAAVLQKEALIVKRYLPMPGDTMRVLALFGLLLIATQIVACDSTTPVRYDRGTFRFNWGKRKDVTQERMREFEGQYDRSIQLLVVKMQDGIVLDAVRSANVRERDVTPAQIEELDRKWRSSGEEIAQELTDKKCNESLILFQRTFRAFAEIFVTSVRGLNVCETNKTTDYYQADEDWWKRTFSRGMPQRQSSLEFDESAGVFAVPVYVPVHDPTSGNVIGVAKAIVLEKPSLQ